jgi:hypothetical protein
MCVRLRMHVDSGVSASKDIGAYIKVKLKNYIHIDDKEK